VITNETVAVMQCKKSIIAKHFKGSFGSHHLELESKNSFVISRITCLAATELVV
jgi:hypothetical protein